MMRPPPRSTRTDTLFPYTTLFRSIVAMVMRETGLLDEPTSPARYADTETNRKPATIMMIVIGMLTIHWSTMAWYSSPSGTTNATSATRSEEHTSELQSLMRISYAVFCLKKKNKHNRINDNNA